MLNNNKNNIIKEKLKKVEELKEMGLEPYGRHYDKVDDISEINKYEETCEKVFKTTRRIVAFRKMGKTIVPKKLFNVYKKNNFKYF